MSPAQFINIRASENSALASHSRQRTSAMARQTTEQLTTLGLPTANGEF